MKIKELINITSPETFITIYKINTNLHFYYDDLSESDKLEINEKEVIEQEIQDICELNIYYK